MKSEKAKEFLLQVEKLDKLIENIADKQTDCITN